ncbi:Hypothetical protein R9X50_00570100 [Acrodontium crateriforme]|uniref:Uncharacterized protein n=1 Tax=Acrodontium crateriforme TaxID=150365 RepID=A0AAQ3RDC1_9PEZI|nr:Hypothetical protein R9X50_00570100 [Acrodontium crateriforme]
MPHRLQTDERSDQPESRQNTLSLPTIYSHNRFEILALDLPSSRKEREDQEAQQSTTQIRRQWRNRRNARVNKPRHHNRRTNNKRAVQKLDEIMSRTINSIPEQDVAVGGKSTYPSLMMHSERHSLPGDPEPVRSIQWRGLAVGKVALAIRPRTLLVAEKDHSPSTTRRSCTSLAPLEICELDFETLFKSRDQRSAIQSPSARSLSSWPSLCLRLFALTQETFWLHGSPIFLDLSIIFEPKTEIQATCDRKDSLLQQWRGVGFRLKKKSRFFPILKPMNDEFRSHPSACRLAKKNESIVDIPIPSLLNSTVVTNLQTADADGSAIDLPLSNSFLNKKHLAPLEKASVVLWNILNENSGFVEYQNASNGVQIPQTYCDSYSTYRDVSPIEIDGKELPHVHSKTLIGTSNERAASKETIEDPSGLDCTIFMGTAEEPFVGINELMMDQEYSSIGTPTDSARPYSLESPILPPVSFDGEPCSLSVGGFDQNEKAVEQNLENSLSRFVNEQQLFASSHILKLKPEQRLNPEEEEEGWMICSTINNASKENDGFGSDMQKASDTNCNIQCPACCDHGYGLRQTSDFDFDWDWDC